MDLEFKVYWEFYQDVKAVAMDLNWHKGLEIEFDTH